MAIFLTGSLKGRMTGQLAAALAAVLLGFGVPAQAEVAAGSYLAALSARAANDFARAAEYFTRALRVDPNNPELLNNALHANVGLGRLDLALPLAQALAAADIESETGALVRLEELARKSAWQELSDLAASKDLPVAPAVAQLVQAWAEVGAGRMSEGLALFDKVAHNRGSVGLGLYHKALALALAGDHEGAEEILSGRSGPQPGLSRRGMIAQATILGLLDRGNEGAALLRELFGRDLDPDLATLVSQLEKGEALPPPVADAREGVAETFYSVGAALAGGRGPDRSADFALVFSRAAEFLQPDHLDAVLLSAMLLGEMGRYDLAMAAYDRIPRDGDHAYLARMGKAGALRRAGRADEAIAAFKRLALDYDRNPAVFALLGDALRGEERFAEAASIYDRAIALYATPEEADWTLFFSRGIAHERSGNWTLAEADLRMALRLQPDQPHVLNYLGYSLIDQNRDLDEALEMIERAVRAMPDDGYITDSLGWAFYRLGRYDEAAQVMERAAQLTPLDPIINDHLGDVLWAVGRQREAEFQWKRALSFEPEEEDGKRIRRKLAVGLDEVLKEEGAHPLTVSER